MLSIRQIKSTWVNSDETNTIHITTAVRCDTDSVILKNGNTTKVLTVI